VRRALVFLVFVLGLVGCASLSQDQTVCPEFRNLRCPNGASCSYDSTRACRVCQCDPITQMTPISTPDQNVPPPVVAPQPSR
jgi:hypothetical protein